METLHTPGPWTVELGRWHEKAPLAGFAIKAEGKVAFVASANMSPLRNHSTVIADEAIAAGITTGFSAAECEANARLISAAPEMLQVIQDLIEGNQLLPGYHYEKVRAAIQKATGQG